MVTMPAVVAAVVSNVEIVIGCTLIVDVASMSAVVTFTVIKKLYQV